MSPKVPQLHPSYTPYSKLGICLVITLGISAFYHDSAAALVEGNQIIAAAQEERFSRKKGDADFPSQAVEYCLQAAGLSLKEVDFVGFYDKPLLTFNRLLETFLAYSPAGYPSFVKSIPVWVKEKIFQKSLIVNELNKLGPSSFDDEKLRFGFHHNSHAASAYFPSGFEEAAILVMDGVGEWATTSTGVGSKGKLRLLNEIRFPHSLGLLYSAFTYYLGFEVNDGEYKVMGLAPYGEPKYTQVILDNLIDLKSDGSFRLNMSYFNYCTDLTMTNEKFAKLFGAPRRHPAHPLTQQNMDIASSVQNVIEEIILKLCRYVHSESGVNNLCLAGGVALNCVANGRILREGPFENVWIQPAAGDSGAALGVALAINNAEDPQDSTTKGQARDTMQGTYLGPEYNDKEIKTALDDFGAGYREVTDAELFQTVAGALNNEKIVGWFQGRMEFGPRALGNRSILGDPRSPRMQRMLNLKIKYRESFRPFAPAVPRDYVSDYFDLNVDSPYMLLVAQLDPNRIKKLTEEQQALTGLAKLNIERSDLPAVTHVDNSARVQTVHQETNPRFYELLKTFEKASGCPVLVNTSFNVRDEPIVCSPQDAYQCFMGTEMDMLVVGNLILCKEDQ